MIQNAMPSDEQIVRDNMKTREREVWRYGRLVYAITEHEVGAIIEDNKRVRAKVVVPPFGSLEPYWPKGESDVD